MRTDDGRAQTSIDEGREVMITDEGREAETRRRVEELVGWLRGMLLKPPGANPINTKKGYSHEKATPQKTFSPSPTFGRPYPRLASCSRMLWLPRSLREKVVESFGRVHGQCKAEREIISKCAILTSQQADYCCCCCWNRTTDIFHPPLTLPLSNCPPLHTDYTSQSAPQSARQTTRPARRSTVPSRPWSRWS